MPAGGPFYERNDVMETKNCDICGDKIEYTSIIDDEYYMHHTRTGVVDMVSRDNICLECECDYYES